MSDHLDHTFFHALLNTSFQATDPVAVKLELVQAKETGFGSPQSPGFALLFTGPLAPALEQGVHRLETAHAVVMDIFLVPVARRADHMEYEAIFN